MRRRKPCSLHAEAAAAVLVETQDLTKTYGAVAALRECTLGVEPGEVFGLLGPNGAGKTTLIRLLLGYLRPTSGWARVAGIDCQRSSVEVRRQVSYLPAEASLFPNMRGTDVLRFFADIRPGGDLQRALLLAGRLELDLARKVSFMSTGMRQKLALAATLAVDAPLYILDEPTANLDPTVRATVLAMVAEARQRGSTVMFSSHVLSEVEEVCDRVVILRAGQPVFTQVMAGLRQQHRILATLNGPLPPPPAWLQGELKVVNRASGEVAIETPGELAPLLGWLSTLPLNDVRIEPVGLRAVYERYHSERSTPPLPALAPTEPASLPESLAAAGKDLAG